MRMHARHAESRDIQDKTAGTRKPKAAAKVKEKAGAKEKAKVQQRIRLDGNPVPRDRQPQHTESGECMQ